MANTPKPYTKGQILEAMDKTKSIKGMARYLGCSYYHIRNMMRLYIDEETGKNFAELHKNQCGKGIPKFLSTKQHKWNTMPPLKAIIEGGVDVSSFPPDKIKYRLIEENYLKQECYKCGFHEHRMIDNKIPLILNFKNKNKKCYTLSNLELLCYNCMFLYIGEVFTDRDIESMESIRTVYKTSDKAELELDPYHIEKLKSIGIWDEKEEFDIVSRK